MDEKCIPCACCRYASRVEDDALLLASLRPRTACWRIKNSWGRGLAIGGIRFRRAQDPSIADQQTVELPVGRICWDYLAFREDLLLERKAHYTPP